MSESSHDFPTDSARLSRRLLKLVVAICILGNIILLAISLSRKATAPDKQLGPTAGSSNPTKALLDDERSVYAQYGGSPSCRSCHEEAFTLWKTSNHALAERPLDPALDRTAFQPSRTYREGSQLSEACW